MSILNYKGCKYIFVLLFSTVILSIYISKFRCRGITCIKSPLINKYSLSEKYEDSKVVFRALYIYKDTFIRVNIVSNIEKTNAQKEIDSRVVKMQNLFANAASPYPGEISDTVVCTEEFKPILKTFKLDNEDYPYFTGYLNNRLVFGSCVEDQLKHEGLLGIFYCPTQRKLYQIEYIRPKNQTSDKNEFLNFISSISCK